jgi:hypothetical protein
MERYEIEWSRRVDRGRGEIWRRELGVGEEIRMGERRKKGLAEGVY